MLKALASLATALLMLGLLGAGPARAAAKPAAKSAWDNVRDGAVSFGRSVKTFPEAADSSPGGTAGAV